MSIIQDNHVLLYTECENGKFGENCSMTCNCKIGSCNKKSGECRVPGCVAGFMGNTCSKGKMYMTLSKCITRVSQK